MPQGSKIKIHAKVSIKDHIKIDTCYKLCLNKRSRMADVLVGGIKARDNLARQGPGTEGSVCFSAI